MPVRLYDTETQAVLMELTPEQLAERPKKEGPIDVDSVFAKLGGSKRAE